MNPKSVRKNTKAMRNNPSQGFIKLEERISRIEQRVNIDPFIIPEQIKYIVYHKDLQIFTTIGAKNIHHAFNKATKLFKGEYSGLYKGDSMPNYMRWKFVSVAEFNKLITQ